MDKDGGTNWSQPMSGKQGTMNLDKKIKIKKRVGSFQPSLAGSSYLDCAMSGLCQTKSHDENKMLTQTDEI